MSSLPSEGAIGAALKDSGLECNPFPTGTEGIYSIERAYEDGTEEIRLLLEKECSFLYECKMCLEIFRGVQIFAQHKMDKESKCKGYHVENMVAEAVEEEVEEEEDEPGPSTRSMTKNVSSPQRPQRHYVPAAQSRVMQKLLRSVEEEGLDSVFKALPPVLEPQPTEATSEEDDDENEEEEEETADEKEDRLVAEYNANAKAKDERNKRLRAAAMAKRKIKMPVVLRELLASAKARKTAKIDGTHVPVLLDRLSPKEEEEDEEIHRYEQREQVRAVIRMKEAEQREREMSRAPAMNRYVKVEDDDDEEEDEDEGDEQEAENEETLSMHAEDEDDDTEDEDEEKEGEEIEEDSEKVEKEEDNDGDDENDENDEDEEEDDREEQGREGGEDEGEDDESDEEKEKGDQEDEGDDDEEEEDKEEDKKVKEEEEEEDNEEERRQEKERARSARKKRKAEEEEKKKQEALVTLEKRQRKRPAWMSEEEVYQVPTRKKPNETLMGDATKKLHKMDIAKTDPLKLKPNLVLPVTPPKKMEVDSATCSNQPSTSTDKRMPMCYTPRAGQEYLQKISEVTQKSEKKSSKRKQNLSQFSEDTEEITILDPNDPKNYKKRSDVNNLPVYLSDKQEKAFFCGLREVDKQSNARGDPYQCSYCQATMPNKNDGRRHMVSHIRVMRLRCGLCGAGAFFGIDMRNHLMNRGCPELHKAPRHMIKNGQPCMTKQCAEDLTLVAHSGKPGSTLNTSGKIVSITSIVPYLPDPKIEEKMLEPTRIAPAHLSPKKPRKKEVTPPQPKAKTPPIVLIPSKEPKDEEMEEEKPSTSAQYTAP